MGNALDYNPFILLATQREGSNMVMSALRTHPQISVTGLGFPYWKREIMADYEGVRAEDMLRERVFRGATNLDFWNERPLSEYKAVGFKLALPPPKIAAAFPDLCSFLRGLRVRVIILRRQNLLKQYISELIARKTAIWVRKHDSQRPTRPVTVAISLADAEAYFRKTLRQYARQTEEFAGCRGIVVYYEDLVNYLNRELARVSDLLGLDRRSMTPATLRIESRPLSEIITNFDTFCQQITRSRWAHLLDE